MTSPIIAADVGFGQQVEIERLEMNVKRRLNGRVRGFRLLLQSEGLILQGRASTYHAKQLAQHAVMQGTRLPILVNEIDVEVSFGTPSILVDC